MTGVTMKEQAHSLVVSMPGNSTWDDLIHEIYVRKVIERGLEDSNEGRVIAVREVRAKYVLPQLFIT